MASMPLDLFLNNTLFAECHVMVMSGAVVDEHNGDDALM